MNSFLRADEELCKVAAGGSLADRESGSTALVALVSGTQLLVANAGDSRCSALCLSLICLGDVGMLAMSGSPDDGRRQSARHVR